MKIFYNFTIQKYKKKMIFYPNCKINLGLRIMNKRTDGYHNIETVLYPLSAPCDILEIVQTSNTQTNISVTGAFAVENDKHNICYKAYQLIKQDYEIPSINMNLHKQIPFGAGLGGGSSDAACTLMGIRDLFELPIENTQLAAYADRLGSDVPFFLWNRPMQATGRGEILNSIDIDLKGYYLILIKPHCQVSTAAAYAAITPYASEVHFADILKEPVKTWKTNLVNDFETSVFQRIPEIKDLKAFLYAKGALYASMSGSGSAVYALSEYPISITEYQHQIDFSLTIQL